MKKLLLFLSCLICSLAAHAEPPYLQKNAYNAMQLIVAGKPFLMLAGEVNNSSGSNIEYMDKTMKSLREANLNSVLVSVSWEIIEPREGVFDFSSVDELIRVARKNDLKLGLLWFAAWKNALSPYAPVWVIQDTKRFARVKNDKGQNTRILTPLCEATNKADAAAFAALMSHIKAIDRTESTVLIAQVENEVGTLSQTRDLSDEANRQYASPVPDDLIQYMVKHKDSLEIELKTAWQNNGSKTRGTWTEVFGPGDQTDLFFMAWAYSRYLNMVAQAGKKAYDIPLYANCWMPQPRPNPGKPGNYPSGGPILTVLDIWKAGAPSIDMLSPDLYGGDFKDEAHFFHRSDNPLFIPETNTSEGPGTYAFAQEDAIGFSPFGIDNRGNITAREYALLRQLVPVITKYQGSGKMTGLYKTGGDDNTGRDFMLDDDVKISVRYSGGFGGRDQNQSQTSYGIFIQTGENEFILAGYNLSVTASSTNPIKEVWLKDAWEGTYDSNGQWKPIGLHNGDEAGFLRSGDPIYRVSGYHTSDPAIFRFKVAKYER
ncbi:hypothetical protein IAD21_05400 [Abditibacteriota bacterium]|nr:hypothetical protein IAD21_05400 [Abditibacteriota bacterium]